MPKIGVKVIKPPGIDSFRGRYLYLALFLSFPFVLTAYYGYSDVEQANSLLTNLYQQVTGQAPNRAADQQLLQLSDIMQQISRWIVGITVAAILLIGIIYLLAHRLLLKPLAETIHAIKLEEPEVGLSLSHQPISETRDLVDALGQMVKQMRGRHAKLNHMAHHDALTGLPNRVLFRDRLIHALQLAERQNRLLSVMFMDLDGFKIINDSLGHAVGDQLLVAVAERLHATVRESDTVARLGGDEFAILLEFVGDQSEVSKMAEKILLAFKPPFILEDQELYISASIGVALSPTDGADSDHLIQAADAAMYEAKRAGKRAYRFYAREMTEQAAEHLELENRLRQAIIADEFEFHFSPIAEAGSLRVRGYEALLRWRRSDQEILTPKSFLPLLEETGLMTQVVERLLEDVAHMQAAFRDYGAGDLYIAVNLSASFLHNELQSVVLLSQLISGRLSPRQLMLEVTEEALAKDPDSTLETLNKLKALGVRVALDDFGAGQSSLSHLRRFPFDVVKIDREFVRNVEMDSNDANLAEAVIRLGHAFNIEVIGEGVESDGQLNFLREHGCDAIQGYLLGYPTTEQEVMALVKAEYQSKVRD